MSADFTSLEELRKDHERLEWLLSAEGRLWLYWQSERGETPTRAHVDAAMGIYAPMQQSAE